MLTTRTATLTDVPALTDLWGREGGPTGLPCGPSELQRLLARDPEATLVAVDGDDVVGSLIVGWDGWRCHLYRLAVEPSARRQGVAGRLVEAGRDRARDLGVRRLEATVHPDNTGAIEFWRSAGFTPDVHGRWTAPL